MLPRKIFETLHTVVAVLALFEEFSVKFCLKFLPLNLSVSPNMMHFVRTVHFRLLVSYHYTNQPIWFQHDVRQTLSAVLK